MHIGAGRLTGCGAAATGMQMSELVLMEQNQPTTSDAVASPRWRKRWLAGVWILSTLFVTTVWWAALAWATVALAQYAMP
jgi:hypothetical protein